MRSLVRRLAIDDVDERIVAVEGVPFGLTQRVLNVDPQLPGATMMIDVPAGWVWDGPAAFAGELEAFVVTGQLTVNGQTLPEQTYVRADPGAVLRAVRAEGDCELLLFTRGAVRLVPPTPDAPELVVRSVAAMVAAGDYDLVPAGDPNPIKQLRLRRFTEGGSCTDVGIMEAGFARQDFTVHESDEEVLMLSGWTATDRDHVFRAREYLCWPAGWIHGPVQGYGAVYVEKHHGVKSAVLVPRYVRGVRVAE